MNIVHIIGRLGKDPEQNEKQTMTSFSVATNDGWGENKKTNWHNCRAFGQVQTVIMKYFKKGDMIGVTGSVDYYKSDEGKYFTSILVRDVHFVGGGKSENTTEDTRDEIKAEEPDDLLF